MGNTRAILFTMTTYGMWLRGDRRGWVDDGIIYPANPELESADRNRLKYPAYKFPGNRLLEFGVMIGEAIIMRKQATILALHVGTWHTHFVIGATSHGLGDVAKCAKDAVRWGLRIGRPIWADGHDKRFCFDEQSVRNRVRYVERHNVAVAWSARPWDFITDVDEFLRTFSPG
jgi:hypothetical protein